MKNLAYAIICSTGLVAVVFSPQEGQQVFGAFFALVFALATIITNEK